MLPYSRNMCLGGDVLHGKGQKPFQGRVSYSHVVWLDSDMAFQPRDVWSLLEHREHCVAGFYLMEDGVHLAAVADADPAYFRQHGSFKFMTPADLSGPRKLLELDYAGMGCCVMSREMLEDLDYPWFTTRLENLGDGIADESMEDFAFCRKIQDKGYKIYGDTSVVLGHVKSKCLLPQEIKARVAG